MGYFAAGGGLERDIDGLRPSADAGIIRAPERKLHQGKNGVNKSLRGAQREVKDALGSSYQACTADSSSQNVSEPRLTSALL